MFKPGDRIGPYKLIECIGKGGFGEVWLAEWQSPLVSRKVALKILNDTGVEAARREAQTWVQVTNHPNVLPFLDANIYPEGTVLASEYCPEGSLQGWLAAYNG